MPTDDPEREILANGNPPCTGSVCGTGAPPEGRILADVGVEDPTAPVNALETGEAVSEPE